MANISTDKPSYRRVVADLAESEERYRLLVEGVRRYAIFMLDPKGIIVTWNQGIYELLGYGRDEIVGQSGAMVFSAADKARGAFKKELAIAARSGESITERSNFRKDGKEIRVHDNATSLLDSGGRLLGFAKVSRAIEALRKGDDEGIALELAKALATIQVEVEHRRRLEAQLLTAVEQERERLGRDLHDDLSQRLAGIAMMIRSSSRKVASRTVADSEKMGQISHMITDAIGVARNLARGLHPITLTAEGLPAALAELAGRVPRQVQFQWPHSTRLEVEQSVALHVYRIAEEAVGNAIRHSEADRITVELTVISKGTALLTITDNGKGFEVRSRPPGMGLQNMKYRAGVIGGTCQIIAAPNSGTIIKCTLPLSRPVTDKIGPSP